jgi:HD superfamily phosphohydrolase
MKHLRCPIWGEIEISDLALSIIDTFEFQRLRYIKQTGLAYKVFPSATTSRFEHCVGVYHVTKMFITEIQKNLECNEKMSEHDKDLVGLVGLLHDLGHGPFSHLFDDWIGSQEQSIISKTHEERSCDIFRQMWEKYNLQLKNSEVDWICNRIVSPPQENWYDTLVNNPYSSFDTDKLDYILRDSRQFGINHAINVDRIFKNIKVIDNSVCFCDTIADEIQMLFETREKMHRSIYRHPMIEQFQHYVKENIFPYCPPITSYETFLKLTDATLFHHAPFSLWEKLETRHFDLIHVKHEKFSDKQKEKAFQNLLFYSRKNDKLLKLSDIN